MVQKQYIFSWNMLQSADFALLVGLVIPGVIFSGAAGQQEAMQLAWPFPCRGEQGPSTEQGFGRAMVVHLHPI